MNAAFRIERGLLRRVHADLDRRHVHAAERVGFLACRTAQVKGGVMLLAHEYLPVADEDYEHDPSVGAMMNSDAIRKALQYAYKNDVAMVHVHRHEHRGVPRFSRVDLRDSAKFVPDFWKVRPGKPHGIMVLSQDAMAGLAWDPDSARAQPMSQYSVVGRPFSFFGRWWR